MELEFSTLVPLPNQVVFAFHANPANLEILLARWPTFRLLSHDGDVAPGCVTWVEERMAIVPVVMAFEHIACEPPLRFAERLFHGPFRRFEHEHRFESSDDGNTRVLDRLSIEVPVIYGGGLTLRRVVEPVMRRLFAFRHAELHRLASDGTVKEVAGRSRIGRNA